MMKQLIARAIACAVLFLAACPAFGQNNFPTPGGAQAPGAVQMCLNASGIAVACNSAGALPASVALQLVGGAAVTSQAAGADAVSNTFNAYFGAALNYLYNGTTWDRFRSINGSQAAGTGTAAIAIAPSTAGGITPVVSAAAEGSHVLKASAGNFYSMTTTTGGTAGFVMTFNLTAPPADGAVTPVECVSVAANSTVAINYNPGPPTAYATGITAVFSSTGCFTKTISNTAFFNAKVM